MSDIRIWLAAFVAAHKEIVVRDAVSGAGYPVLLPTEMRSVRHAGQQMLVERPVFPRYVIIGIPQGVSWYPLRDVAGIQGILCASDGPRSVPGQTIRLLRQAMEQDAFSAKPEPEFEDGQAVKIRIGGTELDAFVRRIKDTLPARRIDVVFSLFGKEHKRTVAIDQVRAA